MSVPAKLRAARSHYANRNAIARIEIKNKMVNDVNYC
ncbi:hypothetical protein Xen7305DRAFT_00005180 [Xenococcus sp. PCC 7305]|nr:hypothetical protein Xen7305DRAFT_00005180 [Xenococcus sp. PCC 7305]